MGVDCLHWCFLMDRDLLEHLPCRKSICLHDTCLSFTALTEMWFICLSQTQRHAIMAGISSKDSATNILPIDVRGTRLKGNVVSREHTWQASCLTRSRSLWTVSTVRIPLKRSSHRGFRASEIVYWSLRCYPSILKRIFRIFKRHTWGSSWFAVNAGSLPILSYYLLHRKYYGVEEKNRNYCFGIGNWWNVFFCML